MLTHGIPWQAVLAHAVQLFVVFFVSMVLSLVSGYFGWYSIFTLVFISFGFFVIISTIPLLLNLSRSFFIYIFLLLIGHVFITIVAFTLHFMDSGLVGPSGQFIPSFYDALYFSITTFTTLGYGDLQPMPDHRLTTSIEALIGMVSMAIGASLIWLWCQENLVPKEMAFWDGNRRNKKDITISRIRVRTITGEERELKDWVPAPEEGESFYYDNNKQEWVKVEEETKVPENSLVIGIKENEDA
nr:ion channel [uncultured Desulfuromonas sp.]